MNIEWRKNKTHISCYDLFIDDKYAHIWVQNTGADWNALQFMYSNKLTVHPTKEAAQEFLIAQMVERRLDEAS